MVLINFETTDGPRSFNLRPPSSDNRPIGVAAGVTINGVTVPEEAHVYSLLGQPVALGGNPTADEILALVESPRSYLNGAGVPLDLGGLKDIKPKILKGGGSGGDFRVEVPALGVAMVVLPGANDAACK